MYIQKPFFLTLELSKRNLDFIYCFAECTKCFRTINFAHYSILNSDNQILLDSNERSIIYVPENFIIFFVNRFIGSKVINFAAADVGAKALFNIWANGVTFEPMDRFTKFNFLDWLESGTELCSAHEYGICMDFDLPFWKNYNL